MKFYDGTTLDGVFFQTCDLIAGKTSHETLVDAATPRSTATLIVSARALLSSTSAPSSVLRSGYAMVIIGVTPCVPQRALRVFPLPYTCSRVRQGAAVSSDHELSMAGRASVLGHHNEDKRKQEKSPHVNVDFLLLLHDPWGDGGVLKDGEDKETEGRDLRSRS